MLSQSKEIWNQGILSLTHVCLRDLRCVCIIVLHGLYRKNSKLNTHSNQVAHQIPQHWEDPTEGVLPVELTNVQLQYCHTYSFGGNFAYAS